MYTSLLRSRLSQRLLSTVSWGGRKPNILGIEEHELESILSSHELPPKDAAQVFRFIYKNGLESFESMVPTVSKKSRQILSDMFEIRHCGIERDDVSNDGTRKWGMKLADGAIVESVFIPDTGRGTACVSSQAGCSVGCAFCATGRNLDASEIVAQIVTMRKALMEYPMSAEGRTVSNVVFMGMGEPLYNGKQVAKAIDIISDPSGCGIGRKKIIVSTSGVVPKMQLLGEMGVTIAISLHAVSNAVRDVLVPINRQWPLEQLIPACAALATSNNRITFEYVMLKGVNDDLASARKLPELLCGISALLNVIPFNPWPGSKYECSDEQTVLDFVDAVKQVGPEIKTSVRWPRGRDISAACGQLRTVAKTLERSCVSV